MLYSGRPKKNSAEPCVSKDADKEYEWAGGYHSFLNDPTTKLFTVEECVFQPLDGDVW